VAKIGRYRTNPIDVFDYNFTLCVEWVPQYCVGHLMMGLNEIGARGEAAVNVPSNLFGLTACLLRELCYFADHKVRRKQERCKSKPSDKFTLLNHLANYAFKLEQYHRAA
jgi:hypothetical protein